MIDFWIKHPEMLLVAVGEGLFMGVIIYVTYGHIVIGKLFFLLVFYGLFCALRGQRVCRLNQREKGTTDGD